MLNDNYIKDFFSIPNIQNCYWAGYIAADGYLHSSHNCLTLKCTEADEEILHQFQNQINHAGKISRSKTRDFYDKRADKTYTTKPACGICIYKAEKYYKDLYKNWNITPKKSLTLLPPNLIDLDLCLSYLIGLIDGDGSIGIYKNGKYKSVQLELLGTEPLMYWALQVLSKIQDGIKSSVRKCDGTYKITISCKKAINIINKLQQIPITWKLPRKWDKFKKE